MPKRKNEAIEISGNTFGKLVRAYREQRHWTQEELAEKWGYTREYVSQIERGKRKLDRTDQVVRLADKGLDLAKSYESKRHITRVQRMYDRLRVTPLGKHPDLRDLEAALRQK